MNTPYSAYLKMKECVAIIGEEAVEDFFERGFPKTGWPLTWPNILDFYTELLTYLIEKKKWKN